MDNLNRIEPNGDARRIEAGHDGGGKDKRDRSGQDGDGPVKANRPSEGLFVDDKNKDERERKAKKQPRRMGEQSEQRRFRKNHAVNVRACGDEDGDRFERVSNGKSLIKNLDGFTAQV